MNILPDAISRCPDFLSSMTTDTAMSNFLDQIRLGQEHDSSLGRYWHYAYSQHTDYNVLTNDLGDFLTYKGELYVLRSFMKMILREYHDTCGHFGQTHT